MKTRRRLGERRRQPGGSALAAALIAAVALSVGLAVPRLPCPLPVGVQAHLFEQVDDLTREGDFVYALAVRSAPDVPIPPARLSAALARLEAVQAPGITRSLTLSALADLRTHLPTIASSTVENIGYNTEHGMTPGDEIGDLPVSVLEFASLTHSVGKTAGWGPTTAIYERMEQEGRLPEFVPAVDRVGVQCQALLEQHGLRGMLPIVAARIATLRSLNPNVAITVVLGIDRNGVDNCVRGFQAMCGLDDSPDAYVPFTSNNAVGLREVIERVRVERPMHLVDNGAAHSPGNHIP